MRSYIPVGLKDYVRLQASRRHHKDAAFILSAGVAKEARLHIGVGVGRDVVINRDVTVGDYTYINRGATLFSGRVGRYCSIGPYAQIGPEQHPLGHLSTSPRFFDDNPPYHVKTDFEVFESPPSLGHDVWVGAHTVILQGVTVGNGAVIAAGAIVTRDVAAFQVVGGVPAKPIGQRFAKRSQDLATRLAWWNMSDAELQDHLHLFAAGDAWPAKLVEGDVRRS